MRKWIIGFTAIFVTLLAFNSIPAMRGGWGWRWPYQRPSEWTTIAVLVALLLIYLVGVWLLRTRHLPIWIALTWSVFAVFVLALGVQNVRDDPLFMLFSHTVSPVQTGASTVAVQFMGKDGIGESLQNWPAVMHQADEKNIIHFSTSPPGQALIHQWLADLIEPVDFVSRPISMSLRPYQCTAPEVMEYHRGELVSAGIGMLMPLWAALAVIPMFFAAFYLTDDRQSALRIAQWMPLIPSLLLFAPTWNTLYPLLATSAFALLCIILPIILVFDCANFWHRYRLLKNCAHDLCEIVLKAFHPGDMIDIIYRKHGCLQPDVAIACAQVLT
jgi:hypothetical protein